MIYLIGSDTDPYVKIGWTLDADRRLREMQTANPHLLQLLLTHPGDVDLEHELHVYFRAAHHRGEWFARYSGATAHTRMPLEVRVERYLIRRALGAAGHSFDQMLLRRAQRNADGLS